MGRKDPSPIEKRQAIERRWHMEADKFALAQDPITREVARQDLDMLMDGVSEILVYELGGISLREALSGQTA